MPFPANPTPDEQNDGRALAGALESEEQKRARLDRLDAIGQALAKSRAEAIQGRQQSGIEQDWHEDLEFYQGIDDANRNEHRSIWHTKPMGQASPMTGMATRSTVFPNITGPYCDAAAARIADMLLPTDDSGWAIKPTPIPELVGLAKGEVTHEVHQAALTDAGGNPDQAAQQVQTAVDAAQALIDKAKAQADKAQKRIESWHIECQYHSQVRVVIEDAAILGTGVLKGPIPTLKKSVAFVNGAISVDQAIKPGSKRIDPWNFFPDPACGENIQNGAYTWERDRVTRKQLRDLKKQPRYISENIDLCLEEGPILATGEESITTDAAQRFMSDAERRGKFEIWYYHGTMERDDLQAAGVDLTDMEDPHLPAMITMVNRRVVRAALNPLDTGSYPYDVMVWRPRANHWTGIGVARQIRTPQRIVVAATRNLMDNAGVACLTADTIVYRNQKDRGRSEITLGEMWEAKHQHNSGLRRMKLRSLDMRTGEFIYNRVVDIMDNGVQPVFEVLTKNGYRIKATENHRFLDELGEWRAVRDFRPGLKIGVNGAVVPLKACVDCGAPLVKPTSTRCVVCAVNRTRNMNQDKIYAAFRAHNLKQAAEAAENRDALESTARQRKAFRDALLPSCERCGGTYLLQVHHKDRDPWNNDRANLETLCDGCHKYEHKRHDHLGNPYVHRYLDFDEIISIRPVGEERVFDLVMSAPNHWFVANGFCSHNSGPMIILRQGMVTPADGVMGIAPRKIWYIGEDADEVLDAKTAFGVIKIDMLVNELMEIIKLGLKLAEDVTGMPLLLQGQQGKAPDTVGGMMLLHNNATAVLRRLARLFDDRVTEPHVNRYYEWLLQYGEDDEKGDYVIDARGSSALVERDIQNEELAGIVKLSLDMRFGLDPKKAVSEYLKSRHFDPKSFEFDDEKWKAILEQMSQKPGSPALQIAQLRAATEEKLAGFWAHQEQIQKQLEQQFEAAENARDRALEMWVRELEDTGTKAISLDEIKAKLAGETIRAEAENQRTAAERGHKTVLELAKPKKPAPEVVPGAAQ